MMGNAPYVSSWGHKHSDQSTLARDLKGVLNSLCVDSQSVSDLLFQLQSQAKPVRQDASSTHFDGFTNHEPWGACAPSPFVRCWLAVLHSLPVCGWGRRLALWLRGPLKPLLGRWVDLEIWGLKLRLRAQGNLSELRLITMPRFLDEKERLLLAEAMRGGGVFFDIGANAGVYSLWLASRRQQGVEIHAFEPDPALCEMFRYNLETNGIQNVRINRLALGAAEGRMTLVPGSENMGENRVSASADEAGNTIEMTTLPRYLESLGLTRIDALKIDIEGHEVDALEPLFRDAPPEAWPRMIICELVHDRESRLADLLQRSGYRLSAKGRLNGIYERSAAN